MWAMDWNGEKWICNPHYNKTRGKKPIQDRADLTLLDIKNCYCNNKDTGIKYGSRLRYQYDTREYTKPCRAARKRLLEKSCFHAARTFLQKERVIYAE